MNKNDFLKSLEGYLGDIPNEERQSALKYYDEYISDADTESESAVIAELGDPKKIADGIKADLNFDRKSERPEDSEVKAETGQKSGEGTTGNNRNTALFIVIILTSPIWGSIAFSLIIAIFSVFAALFISFAAVTVAFISTGLAMIIAGFLAFAGVLANALALLGIGMILLGLGLAMLYLFVRFCKKGLVSIFRGIIELIRMPLRRANIIA